MTDLHSFYADLHVHLGGTSLGNPVKITASRDLTFERIMEESAHRKGIDLVGIVDAVTPEALSDARTLMDAGDLVPLPGGGLRYQDRTTVFLGAEVELKHRGRPVHWVAYLPTLRAMTDFSDAYGHSVKNRTLSTQRSSWTAPKLVREVRQRGGLVFPAHAFTPFKSLFAAAGSLSEALEEEATAVRAVELGLSSDTDLADLLTHLWGRTYLTDSDAHSLPKIAREYNELRLAGADFAEFAMALEGRGGRGVAANYGLDPRLGKYHRTYCLDCDGVVPGAPPVFQCPRCGSGRVVLGVLDRLIYLSRQGEVSQDDAAIQETSIGEAPLRPPYHYQVPLGFVPGIGSRTNARLLEAFGSEMAVLHRASEEDLAGVVGPALASRIAAAREGRLPLEAGGGGHYGRVLIPT